MGEPPAHSLTCRRATIFAKMTPQMYLIQRPLIRFIGRSFLDFLDPELVRDGRQTSCLCGSIPGPGYGGSEVVLGAPEPDIPGPCIIYLYKILE